MDDCISYDVFKAGIYLLSISADGEILYNSLSNQMDDNTVQNFIEETRKKI
jgi:hypothetical protein